MTSETYRQDCITFTFNQLNPRAIARALEDKIIRGNDSTGLRVKLLPHTERNPHVSQMIPEVSNLSKIHFDLNDTVQLFKQEMVAQGWATEINHVYTASEREARLTNSMIRSYNRMNMVTNVLAGATALGAAVMAVKTGLQEAGILMVAAAGAKYAGNFKAKMDARIFCIETDMSSSEPYVGVNLKFKQLAKGKDSNVIEGDFAHVLDSAPDQAPAPA